MMKTYQEEILLRTCSCDFMGTWRPSAILETMQEVAGMHSELLGCGRNTLIQKNLVWVLSRLELHMDHYPGPGSRVMAETFPMPNRRWFFPRYFLFKDEAGRLLGKAGTLWVLFDITTRHMVPPGEVAGLLPDNSDMIAPLGLPAPVEDLPGREMVYPHIPVYTDLDVNMHVNNTKYADWLCDGLGIDVMRENCLQSLVINYDAEIRPDQEITLHLIREGAAFRMAGYHEDKLHFEIGGQLMKRQANTGA